MSKTWGESGQNIPRLWLFSAPLSIMWFSIPVNTWMLLCVTLSILLFIYALLDPYLNAGCLKYSPKSHDLVILHINSGNTLQ